MNNNEAMYRCAIFGNIFLVMIWLLASSVLLLNIQPVGAAQYKELAPSGYASGATSIEIARSALPGLQQLSGGPSFTVKPSSDTRIVTPGVEEKTVLTWSTFGNFMQLTDTGCTSSGYEMYRFSVFQRRQVADGTTSYIQRMYQASGSLSGAPPPTLMNVGHASWTDAQGLKWMFVFGGDICQGSTWSRSNALTALNTSTFIAYSFY